jgi:hypothetical protein
MGMGDRGKEKKPEQSQSRISLTAFFPFFALSRLRDFRALRGKFLLLLFPVTILCLAFAGCAHKTPPEPAVVYPYPASAPKTFYATSYGLVETPQAVPGGGQLASRAPNASVLSSDGRSIVAALNGWGVARIEASPAGEAYRIVGSPLPSLFAGLTTGGAWPVKGGFLLQFYHDPFSDDSDAGPQSVALAPTRLAFFDPGKDAARSLASPPGSDPGYELFALLPVGGRWFAELRKDVSDRVDMRFLSLDDPLAAVRASAPPEIGRAEFQAALQPKPLSALQGEDGKRLRAALSALGAGPWLVRLRSGDGVDAWFLDSGKPEDASPIYAWTDSVSLLALRSDGWIAYSTAGGETGIASLPIPAPDGSFTALAATGRLVAAAWEEGEFPRLASAGLVVAPRPR